MAERKEPEFLDDLLDAEAEEFAEDMAEIGAIGARYKMTFTGPPLGV